MSSRINTALLIVANALLVLLVFLSLRPQPGRFQVVAGYDGLVALDTQKGKLCRTAGSARSKAGGESNQPASVAVAELLPRCGD